MKTMTSIRVIVAAAALFSPTLSWAIGPQYQVVGDPTPAGAGTLNDVVSIRALDGLQIGTGAVIGVTTPNANGIAQMAILTANHVAKDNRAQQASFGVGPGEPGAPGAGAYPLSAPLSPLYKTFTLVDPVNNPNQHPADVSIMVANVNVNSLAGAALAEWNIVKQAVNNFLLAPFPHAIPNPGDVDNTASVNFTEFGYGTAGTYDTAAAKYSAISAQPDDARRFQNNTIVSVSGPFVDNYGSGNYYQPEVGWKILAASPAGGGASFGGDSGGPYLTGSPTNPAAAKQVSVTPSFVDNGDYPAGLTPGVAVNVPVNYFDYITATHIKGSTNKLVGNNGTGVPLFESTETQYGSLDWAIYYANNPQLVPEPSSVVLMLLGAIGLVFAAVRKRRAARP